MWLRSCTGIAVTITILIFISGIKKETESQGSVDQMEASLFESESGKHIWSAWSKSIDFEKLLREDDQQLEQLFIKNLQDHKIL